MHRRRGDASTHLSGAGKFLRHRAYGVARELEEGLVIGIIDLDVAHLRQGPRRGDLARRRRWRPASARLRSSDRTARCPRAFPSGTGLPETIMFKARFQRPPGAAAAACRLRPAGCPASLPAARSARRPRPRGNGRPSPVPGRRPAPSVDCRDHRLWEILDHREQIQKVRRGEHVGRIEFAHVRPSAKHRALPVMTTAPTNSDSAARSKASAMALRMARPSASPADCSG